MLSFSGAAKNQSDAFKAPDLMLIPAGWFWMGSESGQDNERPRHRVWIDEFRLAACQVTNREYGFFLQAKGHHHPPLWHDPNFSLPNQPVVAVSWIDAVEYCRWLSEMTGSRYRLPSEAEWERAARGGEEGKNFPWGDEAPQSLPNYAVRWQNGPEAVAQYSPNRYGLFDICENVHE